MSLQISKLNCLSAKKYLVIWGDCRRRFAQGETQTYYAQGFPVGRYDEGTKKYYVNNHVHMIVDYHPVDTSEVRGTPFAVVGETSFSVPHVATYCNRIWLFGFVWCDIDTPLALHVCCSPSCSRCMISCNRFRCRKGSPHLVICCFCSIAP